MLELHAKLLVVTLAETDAVHWPQRSPSSRSWSRFASARTRFVTEGVPLALSADDHNRRLEREAVAGLIGDKMIVRLSAPGRALRVRLTDTGESRARGLVELPSLRESFVFMDGLAERVKLSPSAVLCDAGPGRGWWIREVELGGCQYVGTSGTARQREGVRQRLNAVVEMSLAMIARRFVEWNSDSEGHLAYRVTDRGLSALSAEVKLPTSDVESDADANEHYITALQRASERIASTDEPSGRGEIGPIPLPSSMLTRREWRRWQSDPAKMLAKVKEQSSATVVGRAK